MSKISFGTDGWRAIIAEDYTFDNVRLCAQAAADYMHASGSADSGIVIGFDTRFGSEDFAKTSAEVLTANGIHVYLCDRAAPTPAISYSILDKKTGGAVIITSSHNPANWNGFKMRTAYGGAAPPDVLAVLEQNIARIGEGRGEVKVLDLARAAEQNLLTRFNPMPRYFAQLGTRVDLQLIKDAGITVVVDAMYGAGMGCFPALLAGGNTWVWEVNNVRNPLFPGMENPEPIAHNLAALTAGILQHHADVGIANDGDADRVGLMDEQGQFINQLQVYALLMLYLLEVRGERGPIVKTVTTTAMAKKLGRKFGVPVYETRVGFKYVGPKMTETGAILGGEESGGFGFAEHVPERDGILAGLYLLDLMIQLGKTPSQLIDYLYSIVGPHYYDRIDVHTSAEKREAVRDRVRDAQPKSIAGLKVTDIDTLDGFRYSLEDGGWLLIRFSGTEPLIRIYTETTHQDKVQEILSAGREIAGL